MYIHNVWGATAKVVDTNLHFSRVLTPDGWRADTRITIRDGQIAALEASPARPDDERHDVAIPGLANVHSHAFQRSLAGRVEIEGDEVSFWGWRETMYRFALTMSPDDVEAVACQAYAEMLEGGFIRVGEFHYLHGDPDGRFYAQPAEMALRIAGAAAETGIALTLLPVFYAHATFGGVAPRPAQRRFVSTLDGFARLYEGCRAAIAPLPGAALGMAPHSLRAVTPDELAAVVALCRDGPIHIHAAEQEKEVADCLSWSGMRPVEWLIERGGADHRWCFVHATHTTTHELRLMARKGVVAGLCPITEADLGDGVFNARDFFAERGRIGVGTDSNVLIGAAEELRQLEYSQRLTRRARTVLAAARTSTGRTLFDAALAGGTAALGAPAGGLTPGARADIVALQRADVGDGLEGDTILDGWIFGARGSPIDCVWSHGRKVVSGGRHVRRAQIQARFRATMQRLTVQ
jgi:formimidoylglutamate deiminase